jgi:nucleoside-diphosphate-sugar epimerase
MKKINLALVGCDGFIGSALARYLKVVNYVELTLINRSNYKLFHGLQFDVLIDAACNSKKYVADLDPLDEAQQSIIHRLETLVLFRAKFHIHISSVDVYPDLSDTRKTKEDTQIDVSACSNYAAHKYNAELLVQHYASNWIIFRLSGMVGPGLIKNPVYDISNDNPIHIHADSMYQYCSTDYVAQVIWFIYKSDKNKQVYNIAGNGGVSPRMISEIMGKKLVVRDDLKVNKPRIINVNNYKLSQLFHLQDSNQVIVEYLKLLQSHSK